MYIFLKGLISMAYTNGLPMSHSGEPVKITELCNHMQRVSDISTRHSFVENNVWKQLHKR